MTLGLLGRKVGMTQIFDKEGLVVPVTVVKLGENIVTECMTKEKNGYTAIQVGGFKLAEKKLTKPEAGVFKKRELAPMKPLKEYRVDDTSKFTVGEPLKANEVLKEGMLVDVRGRSIGKGFQGTVKRFHAGRGPMAHGSKFHRSMGSIGAGTTPGRVFKGVIMPGHMGDENTCIRHIQVVSVDAEKGVLLLRGSVPGSKGAVVLVKPSKTKWNG
jgi:large subunit ribosomal protein L3